MLLFFEDNICEGFIVIVGNLFIDDYFEIKKVCEMGLFVYCYYEFFGKLMEGFMSIGVVGIYGKMLIIGLLFYVLSYIVFISYLIGDGIGKGIFDVCFFVFEVDEYWWYFVVYYFDYVIMMNVDFDYFDYYKDLVDV